MSINGRGNQIRCGARGVLLVLRCSKSSTNATSASAGGAATTRRNKAQNSMLVRTLKLVNSLKDEKQIEDFCGCRVRVAAGDGSAVVREGMALSYQPVDSGSVHER